MALMNFNPVSVAPFRKDHLEACIHSTLSTRSDDPIDLEPTKSHYRKWTILMCILDWLGCVM